MKLTLGDMRRTVEALMRGDSIRLHRTQDGTGERWLASAAREQHHGKWFPKEQLRWALDYLEERHADGNMRDAERSNTDAKEAEAVRYSDLP